MKKKCRIADVMNTYNPALQIIKAKGYKVFLFPDIREEFLGDFWAIKDGREFIGEDPLRVLGLITLWENNGDEWRQKNVSTEDHYNNILERAFPDTVQDIEKLTPEAFQSLVSDYRLFFKTLHFDIDIPNNISPQDMFDIIDSYYKKSHF